VTVRSLPAPSELVLPAALGIATVTTGLIVALGCYLVGPLPVMLAAGALGYLALATFRPDLGLLGAVALAPFESVQLPLAGLGGLSPTEGAFVALAVGWTVRLAQGRPVATPQLVDLPAVVFVVALLPGIALGAPVTVVAKLFIMWAAFFIVSLVARELTRSQIRRLLVTLAAVGAVLGGLGALSYLQGGGAQVAADGTSVSGRASAAIADPNYYGAYLLLAVVPVSGLVVFGVARSWRRVLVAGLVLLGCVGIVLSLSRGALLGLFLAAGLVLLSTSRSRVLTVSLTVLLVAVTAAGLNPLLKTRALEVADTRLSSITSTSTNNERPLLWHAAIDVAEKHPLFGIGALQFESVTQRRGITQRGLPLSNVHNSYLNIAVELGLVGLFAFLAWVLVLARGLGIALRGSRWSRAAAVGVGATLAGFLLQSLTVSPYQVQLIQATFFLLAGISLRLAELSGDDVPEES
jgi:O-antigen ligase